MNVTGKYIPVAYGGIHYELCNQRSREWRHLYEYQGNGSTLSRAGCGVFSIVNALWYLGGEPIHPEELADFSCAHGGRGDDGTDRPALLSAMEQTGLARKCGFSYQFDGLRNDLPILFDHLEKGGAALCNLRPGHIVALVGSRTVNGESQVLTADPYSESTDDRVLPALRDVIPGSEVVSLIANDRGFVGGFRISHAMYWAALTTVRDFNLLHRIGKIK